MIHFSVLDTHDPLRVVLPRGYVHLGSCYNVLKETEMIIGKIVKSNSHIDYVCQIYGPYEVDVAPSPADYAFGSFVQIAIRSKQAGTLRGKPNLTLVTNHAHTTSVVGVIYDTILLNPAFGSAGPRLTNETRVELFSPDYFTEKAVLIYLMVLGMIERQIAPSGELEVLAVMHGVPLLSLELGSEVETMTDEEVREFHFFSDQGGSDPQTANLHLGYLPHVIAQRNSLLPMVILRIIDQLEYLFPQNISLLSIVKRNFAWRLKVETTG